MARCRAEVERRRGVSPPLSPQSRPPVPSAPPFPSVEEAVRAHRHPGRRRASDWATALPTMHAVDGCMGSAANRHPASKDLPAIPPYRPPTSPHCPRTLSTTNPSSLSVFFSRLQAPSSRPPDTPGKRHRQPPRRRWPGLSWTLALGPNPPLGWVLGAVQCCSLCSLLSCADRGTNMPRNRDEMALLRRPRSSSRRQDRTASIEQSGLLWAASRGQCPRISPSAPGNLDKLPTSWSTQICSDLFRSVCVRVSSRWRDGESKADRAPPRAPRVPGPGPHTRGDRGMGIGHWPWGYDLGRGRESPSSEAKKKLGPASQWTGSSSPRKTPNITTTFLFWPCAMEPFSMAYRLPVRRDLDFHDIRVAVG